MEPHDLQYGWEFAPGRCPHYHRHTVLNDKYVEERVRSNMTMGPGWVKVGETVCQDCGKVWAVYQAPGLFD